MMHILRRRKVRFSYPDDFKNEILLLLYNWPAKIVSARYEIPLSTLYRWRMDCSNEKCDSRNGSCHEEHRMSAPACTTTNGFATAIMRANSATAQASEGAQGYRFDAARARESRHVLTRLQRARDLIEARYFEHISCSILAAEAQMSRDHFVRMYKQAYRESPYQHLIRKRARAASRLLRSTLQPTESIASAVGFESASALVRAMRKFARARQIAG